jgi:hypothetical protein
METGSGHSPTPREAAETLRQLDHDARAVRYPPIPLWFFVVMAGLVGGLFLARLLPASDAHRATLALGVVALVLGSRYWLNRPGVSWTSLKLTDMVPFLLAIYGTFALCWIVATATGAVAVWVAGALVGGGVVLHTGLRYRREYGDAA